MSSVRGTQYTNTAKIIRITGVKANDHQRLQTNSPNKHHIKRNRKLKGEFVI